MNTNVNVALNSSPTNKIMSAMKQFVPSVAENTNEKPSNSCKNDKRRGKFKYIYVCIADCGEHGWLPSQSCSNCERIRVKQNDNKFF